MLVDLSELESSFGVTLNDELRERVLIYLNKQNIDGLLTEIMDFDEDNLVVISDDVTKNEYDFIMFLSDFVKKNTSTIVSLIVDMYYIEMETVTLFQRTFTANEIVGFRQYVDKTYGKAIEAFNNNVDYFIEIFDHSLDNYSDIDTTYKNVRFKYVESTPLFH